MVRKTKRAKQWALNGRKGVEALQKNKNKAGNAENLPPVKPPLGKQCDSSSARRKQTLALRHDCSEDVASTSRTPLQSIGNFHCDVARRMFVEVSKTNNVERNKPKIAEPPLLTGRRLLSVNSLNNAIIEMTTHCSSCQSGPVKILNEKRKGLETTLVYLCPCGVKFCIESSDDTTSLPANEALIWGCQVSATGYNAAASMLTTMDIAATAFTTFKRQQDIFQDTLINAIRRNMAEWAEKEKQLAIEAGEFVTIRESVNGKTEDRQYPSAMVYLDGCWSKRSYGHSYSANCGLAVIIGVRTGKVIYVDVKIATCTVCDRKRTNEVPPHDCSKNWTGPPTGMESSIIAEGFSKSISDYGLVYGSFIGDGDSSVHSKVKYIYPGYEVKKIECKNHVVRNFTTKLMDIATNRVKGTDEKISADERRLINPKLPRFRKALVQAIKYNSENGTDFKELRHDILNIPMHIFGSHSKCRGYYQCNLKDVNMIPSVTKMNFWVPLMRALERVAGLAPSLIMNKTSNKAECFMSVACKYAEGKRKNFGQRGLYKIRMAGALLSYNVSQFWAKEAFKLIKGKESLSNLWTKLHDSSVKRRQMKAKHRVRRPLKFPCLAERRGDLDYGSDPQTPDMDDELLEIEISSLRSKLQVTPEKVKEIEISTRGQSENPEWFRQRYGRLTGSFAPVAFKLQPTTSNKASLDDYFKRKRIVKPVKLAMQYGKENEPNAIAAYEKEMRLSPGTVKSVGLIVDATNGVLAASPDGTVGEDGLVEVKCPHSLLTNSTGEKALHPREWPEVSKSSSLKRLKGTNELQLNRSHDHYRQIVMQLHVSGRSWCDYVIWSESGTYIERIERSEETTALWLQMKEKLLKYWQFDLAPELIDSRYDRGFKNYRSPPTRKK